MLLREEGIGESFKRYAAPVSPSKSHSPNDNIVWIEQVSIARPMVPERDKTATERRVFPSEVRRASLILLAVY